MSENRLIGLDRPGFCVWFRTHPDRARVTKLTWERATERHASR